MNYQLEINTDNDAFQDGYLEEEIARILRELASRIEKYGACNKTLFDINGNNVGDWSELPFSRPT